MTAFINNQPPSAVQYWPVGSSTVIDEFDLLAVSSGNAVRLSALSDGGSLAANQAAAAAIFIGRAVGKRTGTEGAAGQIAVVNDVVTYACASTTWAKGDLVGPVENAGGDALVNQTVAKVTNPLHAIGRCVTGGTSLTKVQVELFPFNANITTVAQQVADT